MQNFPVGKELVPFNFNCSDCALKNAAPQARDDEAAKKLWTLSEEMVGLKT